MPTSPPMPLSFPHLLVISSSPMSPTTIELPGDLVAEVAEIHWGTARFVSNLWAYGDCDSTDFDRLDTRPSWPWASKDRRLTVAAGASHESKDRPLSEKARSFDQIATNATRPKPTAALAT